MRTITLLTITLAFCIISSSYGKCQGYNKVELNGSITDAGTGEPLPWAALFVDELNTGATTNAAGSYSLSLLPGRYTIKISYVGYEEISEVVEIRKSIMKNFTLSPSATRLSAFVISDKKGNENITETTMSVVKMNTETIKKIPALMGETDLLKTIQLLPGVQNAAEGFSGFSVRGGSTDQNLMLLDDATVYNASHLMGFFSVFNSDAVKEMTLYKGDIPAHYGGRLASLVDVKMKEADMEKVTGRGGIGSISSRLTIETPLKKESSSLLLSGRRTYADLFLKLSKDSLLNDNQLFFHDLNAKGTFVINKNNRLHISGYSGMDVFAFRSMMDMQWANHTGTVRWSTLLSQRLSANFLYAFSGYDYRLNNNMGASSFIWTSGIRDHSVRGDFNYYQDDKGALRFGFQVTRHNFKPGKITSQDKELLVDLNDNKSLEYALFATKELSIGKRLNVQAGLRFSAIQNIGEATVFMYDEQYNLTDSMFYSKGEVYNTYCGLEPRISGAYLLSDKTSVKAGIARTRQYVQPASNSSSGMPHDIWFPVSPNLKPQVSDQASIGIFRNFLSNMIETSVEGYCKKMDNQIDFRHNADIFFNEKLEGEIRTGIAKAYGLEVLIRKQYGSFTGWIGYTLSKVERRIDEINDGNWYSADYDKPHNLTIVLNYDISERIAMGATWIYTTGAPITLPTGRWEHAGLIMPGYSERNGYRLPDYHRLDISSTIQLNKVEKQSRVKSELNFSVYNAYNRKNPFTIFFQPEKPGSNTMKAYALSMFGIVPSVTWNFRF